MPSMTLLAYLNSLFIIRKVLLDTEWAAFIEGETGVITLISGLSPSLSSLAGKFYMQTGSSHTQREYRKKNR